MYINSNLSSVVSQYSRLIEAKKHFFISAYHFNQLIPRSKKQFGVNYSKLIKESTYARRNVDYLKVV